MSTEFMSEVDPPPPVIPEQDQKLYAMVSIRMGDRWIIGSRIHENDGAFRYYIAPRGRGAEKKATWFSGDPSGWAEAWATFVREEPVHAAAYSRAQNSGETKRPTRAPAVPLLTIPTLPGHEIEAVAGMVIGSAVMSRNLLSDFGSEVTSAFGGRLGGIEKAIENCVLEARQQVYEQAQRLRADAVVGVSIRLESVADKAQAVLISGTAVTTRTPSDSASAPR